MEEASSIKEGIEKAISLAKKRKFAQTVDMAINFRNVDFSKVDNRLKLEVILPKGIGKPRKIAIIAKDELATKAKGLVDRIISPEELEEFGKDKKAAKKLAKEYDIFLAEPSLMPLVGRYLGQVLGPRGKMPKPVPPNIPNLEPMINRLRNTVYVATKGKYLPVIHVPIGTEEMNLDDLVENAMAILHAVLDKLPQRETNVKNVVFKLTMGPSVVVNNING